MEILIIAFEVILILIILIFIITGITNIITLVPYVPSKEKYLDEIFKNIKKTKKTGTVFDLGSGDGRTLFIAESHGFRSIGYENSLLPYLMSTFKKFCKKSKCEIHFGSLFKANLQEADIIFIYLLPLILKRVSNKILKECKKGTVIISSGFEMPNLKLIKNIPRDQEKRWASVNYYEV